MLRIGCREPAADMALEVLPAPGARQRQQQRTFFERVNERRQDPVLAGEIHQRLPAEGAAEQLGA